MEIDTHGVAPRLRTDLHAEKVDGIRKLQRRAVTGPFHEHGGRHIGQPLLARRIHERSRPNDKIDLHKRNCVLLQQENRHTVRESEMLQSGERKPGRRSQGGRVRPIRLGRHERRQEEKENKEEDGCTALPPIRKIPVYSPQDPCHGRPSLGAASSGLPRGKTLRTTQPSARRYVAVIAWISPGSMAL